MSAVIKKKEPSINTIIGEKTVITGNLLLEGDIIIYGKISGDIETDGTITIFPGSEIKGKLQGANLNIGGHVEGNVNVTGKVTLGDRSFLRGDIKAAQIVIEDGAVFEGRCEMHFPYPLEAKSPNPAQSPADDNNLLQ
ncbi:MAG TPA: polymer-forming cytoskeletal protein [Candidatus Marinimicrobia bacterium]|nr:polymer-forming cytoskeletal protein [Candidatus Neomarinimicrobiota bacterium]HRS51950.1 polymer-forming cytoskeletal protein [Candidatus Neomarinimicrobiota bacterium]HRU91921.1 polymer-forming cytoskeletal protein [Candidatus Neomarinimicrobiota bacterium]